MALDRWSRGVGTARTRVWVLVRASGVLYRKCLKAAVDDNVVVPVRSSAPATAAVSRRRAGRPLLQTTCATCRCSSCASTGSPWRRCRARPADYYCRAGSTRFQRRVGGRREADQDRDQRHEHRNEVARPRVGAPELRPSPPTRPVSCLQIPAEATVVAIPSLLEGAKRAVARLEHRNPLVKADRVKYPTRSVPDGATTTSRSPSHVDRITRPSPQRLAAAARTTNARCRSQAASRPGEVGRIRSARRGVAVRSDRSAQFGPTAYFRSVAIITGAHWRRAGESICGRQLRSAARGRIRRWPRPARAIRAGCCRFQQPS